MHKLSIRRALVPAARMLSLSAAMLLVLGAALGPSPAAALTLSSNQLDAAQRLGCVLADDALGYLNEDQFNRRFDEAVGGLSDEQVDVIYAKALGYIDGLLFGVSSQDPQEANGRLLSYSNSGNCDFGVSKVSRTVSL